MEGWTVPQLQTYFDQQGWFPTEQVVGLVELTGGVSSLIYRVQLTHTDVILKQPLPTLKTTERWDADPGRASNEVRGLQAAQSSLPAGSSPSLYHFDDTRNVVIMSALPADAPTWKTQLMLGTVDPNRATEAGTLLGKLHQASWDSPRWKSYLDEGFRHFTELRLAPYFEFLRDSAPRYSHLVDEVVERLADSRKCIVHGDFSPKNLICLPNGLALLDWEVVHYGNPSFDLGFLTTHLTLKFFYHRVRQGPAEAMADQIRRFWTAYGQQLGPVAPSFADTSPILSALLVARINGKSPVEYLDRSDGERVFTFADRLIAHCPDSVFAYVDLLKESC